jgi:hypothetical protein
MILYFPKKFVLTTNQALQFQKEQASGRITFVEYLEKIKNPMTNTSLLFFRFVTTSENIDMDDLQAYCKSFDLFEVFFLEQLAVAIKLGNSEEALRLLAIRLHDHLGAEEYCLINVQGNSSDSSVTHYVNHKDKSNMSHGEKIQTLINIYIAGYNEQRDIRFSETVMGLIERYHNTVSIDKMLEILPASWSFSVMSGFIIEKTRQIKLENSLKLIEKSLLKAKHLQTNGQYFSLLKSSTPVALIDEPFRKCTICLKSLMDPNLYVWLPGEKVVHLHCFGKK